MGGCSWGQASMSRPRSDFTPHLLTWLAPSYFNTCSTICTGSSFQFILPAAAVRVILLKCKLDHAILLSNITLPPAFYGFLLPLSSKSNLSFIYSDILISIMLVILIAINKVGDFAIKTIPKVEHRTLVLWRTEGHFAWSRGHRLNT